MAPAVGDRHAGDVDEGAQGGETNDAHGGAGKVGVGHAPRAHRHIGTNVAPNVDHIRGQMDDVLKAAASGGLERFGEVVKDLFGLCAHAAGDQPVAFIAPDRAAHPHGVAAPYGLCVAQAVDIAGGKGRCRDRVATTAVRVASLVATARTFVVVLIVVLASHGMSVSVCIAIGFAVARRARMGNDRSRRRVAIGVVDWCRSAAHLCLLSLHICSFSFCSLGGISFPPLSILVRTSGIFLVAWVVCVTGKKSCRQAARVLVFGTAGLDRQQQPAGIWRGPIDRGKMYRAIPKRDTPTRLATFGGQKEQKRVRHKMATPPQERHGRHFVRR